MASAKIEARTNIKFMLKLGWKNSQIIDSLEQVYGDNAPKKSATYKWISRFRRGRNETEDDPRSSRPCTSVCVENIDAVRDLIEKDRRITTESVADTLNISVGSAHTILVDSLGLSKLSARWVPRLLRPDQQESMADLSMEILNKWDENPELLLQRIVTGDETWLYQYDPEDKTQSKQWLRWGGSEPVKAKSERSKGKVMATVFWDAEGILLVHFLENKKTITAVYYEEILRNLSKKIAEKRPGKLLRRILFHHDNAPAHSARQTRAVLREFRWEIIRHPPYSPDLAPSDFFLFPNLKKSLKGKEWIRDPFVNKPGESSISAQEEDQLLEIANDGGLKTTFETTTLPVFWIKVMVEYPEIATTALKSLLPFPTSYLCEAGFSAVTATKTKQQSKLGISNTHRVSLSPITSSWNRLVAEKQARFSLIYGSSVPVVNFVCEQLYLVRLGSDCSSGMSEELGESFFSVHQ
ncbi:Transposase type 1 [Trinorchestia longiramus]|nr:Transposase type 1 [Trinorchestia longiramus]